MSAIGEVAIRVSPEQLEMQADLVERLADRMQNSFIRMEETVAGMSHYWAGEASELHRRLYQEKKEDIDLLLKRLREHPRDLKEIAQNYRTAETTNVTQAAALDVEIIS